MPESAFDVIHLILRYGWLLLVVLLALTLLFHFDIIRFDPSSCSLSGEISCLGFERSGRTLTLELENAGDAVILGVDIAIEGCEDSIKGKSINSKNVTLFTFTACSFDEQFTADMNVSYSDDKGNAHVMHGKIIKKSDLFKITS